jgi:hypothetical protein
MATRSFTVAVENWTGKTWKRTADHRDSGVWTDGALPPDALDPFHLDTNGDPQPGSISFEIESDGFGTGAIGSVAYTSDAGTIGIYFSNPYAGGNKFYATGPDGFQLLWGDPGGSDAKITLVIRRPH